jgi:hypothetical protein
MRQIHAYTIDLTRIGGSGDFPCPRCGAAISPDDCTEEAYEIVEPKVSSYGLEEVVICCRRCGSQIHLTGFSLLQKLEKAELEQKRNSGLSYFAHV